MIVTKMSERRERTVESGRAESLSDERGKAGRSPEDIITGARTVAVVGLSTDVEKPSHEVATYLKLSGYHVIPVNPKEESLLGERSYASVADIPEPVDVVDVFLRSERVPAVARDAVRAGAKVLWLQQGITSEEGARNRPGGRPGVRRGPVRHADAAVSPADVMEDWRANRSRYLEACR